MPSAAVLASEGVKAVSAGQYQQAIDKLSEALKERPAPLWLLERSKAYLRTNDFDHALFDAEKALGVAFDRANRDQMIEAQIRRAVTFYRMGRYADADICAFWAIRIAEGAKASEDDGQQRRVDANGDYVVGKEEIANANQPDQNDKLAAAMGGGQGRSKEKALKDQAFTWRVQALTKMEKLPAGDKGRKVHISSKYPTPTEPTEASKKNDPQPPVKTPMVNNDDLKIGLNISNSPHDTWKSLWEYFTAVHAKNNIRSSFYQTDATVNIDFFVKNVPKDDFTVEAAPQSVTLRPIPNTPLGSVQLFLFGKIKPAETRYTVKSMKVELVLQKEIPGKWPTLRQENAEVFDHIVLGTAAVTPFNQFHGLLTALGYNNPADLQPENPAEDQEVWYKSVISQLRDSFTEASGSPAQTAPNGTNISSQPKEAPVDIGGPIEAHQAKSKTDNAGPAYPTSSKKGPKNWDKFSDEEEDEKESGDVNSFFQQLYKDADEDTRRAMMKSFVESNGTSLSTSWSEAKGKTYETLPPDGADAKKWDE
ncbi:SGS domain-containing protein [Xylariomycetidae sp. FL2044]|nr:SGS domain-containing protein [Xylariomycetidae sp. FL2044]